MLYFAVRQGDTNPVAHRLLDRFGSLHAVFEAPPNSLEVEGVGPHTADLIKPCTRWSAAIRRTCENGAHSDRLNSRSAWAYLCRSCGRADEVLLAAYLDGAGRVSNARRSPAAATHVPVDAYKIARNALLCGAAGVAVAHNHPSGPVHPRRISRPPAGCGRRSGVWGSSWSTTVWSRAAATPRSTSTAAPRN